MGMPSLKNRALALLARHVVLPGYMRQYARFNQAATTGGLVQREQLFRWLGRCSSSRFGREHDFKSIRSVQDYRRQVPVSDYEAFAPYINSVANGDHQALLPQDEPVRRFTITTGSTGCPKLNPVTPTWMRHYRQSWSLWGGKMLVDHMRVVGKKILHIIGSWDMGRTSGGIPISMVSALLARNQHPLVRPFYSVPNEVTDIHDPDARYYATLRLSIADDIGLIVVMNPGTLLRLARFGDEQRESLIRDIHDGTIHYRFDVPTPIRQSIIRRIAGSNPGRARELERIVERTGHLFPADYWDRPVIACWLGGTAGYQAKYLSEYFGDSPTRDQGLVSSEGRHTIPVHDTRPEGLLAINNGFYEFIPVNDRSPNPTVLEGHELEIDADYQIVMTTFSGYFRFRIGDVVRCRGMNGQTPVLEFLHKADRCGDLEGEKVTEFQFLEAASNSALEGGIRLGPVTAVPIRPDGSLPRYQILVEQGDVPDIESARLFLQGIDSRLCSTNFLYNARRRERVLGPPVLSRIPTGTWSDFVQSEIERRGTGEAHYKHAALVQNPDFLSRFHAVDLVELTTA